MKVAYKFFGRIVRCMSWKNMNIGSIGIYKDHNHNQEENTLHKGKHLRISKYNNNIPNIYPFYIAKYLSKEIID